jgi:hypothetical protein
MTPLMVNITSSPKQFPPVPAAGYPRGVPLLWTNGLRRGSASMVGVPFTGTLGMGRGRVEFPPRWL